MRERFPANKKAPQGSLTIWSGGAVERVKGIEPSYAAWEAAVLPLNYTRVVWILKGNKTPWRIFKYTATRGGPKGEPIQISSARNRAMTRPCASNRRSVRASMLKLVTVASAARKALSCRMPVLQVRVVTEPSVKRKVLRSSA